LRTVCNNLLPCNYTESELVKATENSLRHVGCVYAQELALAHPNLDTRKILEYASTKWNVPEYYPNIYGTSGYCIPISSKYVKYGAKEKQYMGIINATLTRDNNVAEIIANKIYNTNPRSIGIVGISYLGNIKVSILSGALRFLKAWRDLFTNK